MKNLVAIFLTINIALVAACGAQDVQSVNKNARSELIDKITGNPIALKSKWNKLGTIFRNCKKISEDTALDCEKMEGIRGIDLIEGPSGSVTIEFEAPATCDEIYKIVSQNLGSGLVNKTACDTEWNLKKVSKGLSASIYTSKRNPSRIFFIIGYEQGP